MNEQEMNNIEVLSKQETDDVSELSPQKVISLISFDLCLMEIDPLKCPF